MQAKWIFLAAAIFLLGLQVKPQDTIRLSLPEILNLAVTNYPRLKASNYEFEASKENIKIQKQTSIPSLDASYQANLATANNITGMLYPQYIMSLTGPPSSANQYNPVTGSAASLLLQWQPGFFGERKSKINLAIATSQTAQSKNEQEIFYHKVKVSNQYIDIAYFEQLLKLYEDNILISERQLRQVNVLAVTGLKPGVDTALIKAELSRTRIEWLKIKNSLSAFLSSLQESLATDSIIINRDTLFFASIPQRQTDSIVENPLLKTTRLSIEEAKLKSITIRKLAAPHFSVWGTTYARGSGIDYNGAIKTMDGFVLSRFNYGAGVQLAVPLLKHAEIKTRVQQQDWLVKSEEEKLNQVSMELKQQRKLAETTFSNALSIINETPIQVHAAEYAFQAMQIRYTNGLVNYSELLQTQSDLLKAKIEMRKSEAELWKALLYKAAVEGDLNLFINQVK